MKFFTLFVFFISAHLHAFELKLVNQAIPDALYDIRYFGTDNFLGVKVDGYKAPHCYLAPRALNQLKKVQVELMKYSLSLKIFDCYRPQSAVNHFVRWAENLKDIKTKAKYYPNLKKGDLFKKGYISSKSGHSRGSTIDLTLADLKTKKELDMGTGWDFLDPLSNTANPKISIEQKRNRLLLKSIMEKFGFRNYSKEWWHFTLNGEEFPNIYFKNDVL